MVQTTLVDIEQIRKDLPDITFRQSHTFYWSAQDKCVYFNNDVIKTTTGFYQLLHEIGHGLCAHKRFASGIQLLKMETEAWAAARTLAEKYGIKIKEDHIEACLDSYRDWLHVRSLCPNCHVVCPEFEENHYRCSNCAQKWHTPADQRTRCYRKKIGVRR